MPKYFHTKEEFKVIPYSEAARIVNTAYRESRNLRDAAIIALVWLTGARIGEVLAAKKEDVDIDLVAQELRIRLMTEKIKSHPIRELYFALDTPMLEKIVIPFVKGSPTNQLFDIGVRRAEQILRKVNQITGYWYTFHEFRHSRLTYLARNLRASMSEMMDWTGWRSTKEIGTYVIRGAPKRFKDKIR